MSTLHVLKVPTSQHTSSKGLFLWVQHHGSSTGIHRTKLCASTLLCVRRLLWVFPADIRDSQKEVLSSLLHCVPRSKVTLLLHADTRSFTFQPPSPKCSFANAQTVNCQTCLVHVCNRTTLSLETLRRKRTQAIVTCVLR